MQGELKVNDEATTTDNAPTVSEPLQVDPSDNVKKSSRELISKVSRNIDTNREQKMTND